jgi:hypothetical protein
MAHIGTSSSNEKCHLFFYSFIHLILPPKTNTPLEDGKATLKKGISKNKKLYYILVCISISTFFELMVLVYSHTGQSLTGKAYISMPIKQAMIPVH